MNWRERITVDPAICNGKACIKGTRVLVTVILDSLAAGESMEEIAKANHLQPEDIRAALLWARDSFNGPPRAA